MSFLLTRLPERDRDMDVAALRNELEQHLANNPHPEAPGGFRDRFDEVVSDLEASGEDDPRSALEAQLQQICVEAKAAAAAGLADNGATTDSPSMPGAPDPSGGDRGRGRDTARRLAVPIAVVVAALVAGYFVLR